MEFFTILLSSLITLVSPVGLVVDQVAENAIRDQFESVEQLQVRVDSAPSYQIAQGKAEKVRIASRGVFPVKEFRIAALEIETDPIDVNPRRLDKQPFDRPLQAGVRLVVTQADINQALRSPTLTKRLQNLGIGLLDASDAKQVQRYDFLNPQVTFLPNNRIRLQAELQEQGYPERLRIVVESGLSVISGRRLQLLDPQVLVNDEAVPEEIVDAIAEGISERFDLRTFEKSGITARLLQFNVVPEQGLEIAAFVRAESLSPPPAQQ